MSSQSGAGVAGAQQVHAASEPKVGVHVPFCNAWCSAEGHWLVKEPTTEGHAHPDDLSDECGLCTEREVEE